MKEYQTDAIRNIAFIGHGGSGKTSISEYLLYFAGETNRIGRVEEGNTISDYTANEIEKQFSIVATPLNIEWNNAKVNFVDTPGYADLIGQVISSLHVVDTAVAVVKSAEGIEVGTETNWELVAKNKLSSAILINKVDNEHSKYEETFEKCREKLTHDATLITFPVKEGLNFNSVIDLTTMKMYTYDEAATKKYTESEIPADLTAKANDLRNELIEKIAETDEELLNQFLEEGTLDDANFTKGLKKAISSRNLSPVFTISASKGVGLVNFLNFVVKYFPSPADVEPKKGKMKDSDNEIVIPCDPKGETCLFIFKSLSEQHVGELSFFKVYSGSVNIGMDLENTSKNKTERMGQIFVTNGKTRKDIAKLYAGDIGAVVKLKDTQTGNTLTSKNLLVVLPEIDFPEPVIRAAVKPKAKGDEDKISSGLHTAHQEDPTLQVHFDPELSQTIVSGQGELQLALATKLLKERYKVEVELVEPRIPYRETIKGVCENAEYKHKKQSGGRGQYGHVVLKLEPKPRGEGFEFVDAIVGGVVPGRFIPAVEKGLKEIMTKGILTGSKVIDIRATLHFGSYHDVDSDEVSFKIAASQAFKKGFMEAKPVILEPIEKVTIKVPEEYMGDVMGDISSRRGKILGMDSVGTFQIINALVPLSELYKYATLLRSLTSGKGTFSSVHSHYEDVPKDVESKIIEEYKKTKEEEAA